MFNAPRVRRASEQKVRRLNRGVPLSHRQRLSLAGVVAGGLLGFALVACRTHGWAGGSDDNWECHQSFLVLRLYDVSGTPDEVATVERWGAIRLHSAAVLVVGLGVALCRVASYPIRRE